MEFRRGDALWAAAAAAAGAALSPPDARWAGGLLAAILTWAALIDARSFVLPNALTLSAVAAGLGAAALQGTWVLIDASIGAVVGYAAFAGLGYAYLRLRGREGLGLGDAKLFAGAGAWVGWQGLPAVSLLAAVTGIAHFGLLAARSGFAGTKPIPFGPHLCAATWAIWRFPPPYF